MIGRPITLSATGALLLASAGLASMVAADMLPGVAPPPPLVRAAAGEATPPPPVPSQATPLHATLDGSPLGDTLARPLFAPDRRPDAGPDAGPAADGSMPRLSGIVTAPGLQLALFATTPHPTTLATGGRLAGCLVDTITADSVTLTCDGMPRTLRPAGLLIPPAPVVRIADIEVLHTKRSDPHLQP